VSWLLAALSVFSAFFKAVGAGINAVVLFSAKKAGRVEAERDALTGAAEAGEQREEVEDEVRRLDRAAVDERLRKWTRH